MDVNGATELVERRSDQKRRATDIAQPWSPVILSEKGSWQRWLIIVLLLANLVVPIVGAARSNQGVQRSQDARPLLCSLAIDDVLANPLLLDAYEQADCPQVLGDPEDFRP